VFATQKLASLAALALAGVCLKAGPLDEPKRKPVPPSTTLSSRRSSTVSALAGIMTAPKAMAAASAADAIMVVLLDVPFSPSRLQGRFSVRHPNEPDGHWFRGLTIVRSQDASVLDGARYVMQSTGGGKTL
jgi:hypothetical protein